MEEITLKHIYKKYHRTCVLENISQTFSCGRAYAFTGHNGCGKSTLLRLLCGLVVPDEGEVVCSQKFRFSYVTENFRPTVLSGRTFLMRMGEIDGIEKKKLETRIEELARTFYLSDMLDLSMQTMSKGTLQKIGVIQALLKPPEILLLDEPLSGQDADSQRAFAKEIIKLKKQGTTVFLACHETWIAQEAADVIFTIENKTLVMSPKRDGCRYKIILKKTDQAELLPEMLREGEDYVLYTGEEETQELLKKLLYNGWIVKGLYHENKSVTSISDADLF